MYFLTEDNTMWYKVSIDMKKEFDSEPVYKKEFLKTKVTSHGNEVKDFCDKENPKWDSNHTCLAVSSLDSALKKDWNRYPQVFLKECKCIEKNVVWYIHDN